MSNQVVNYKKAIELLANENTDYKSICVLLAQNYPSIFCELYKAKDCPVEVIAYLRQYLTQKNEIGGLKPFKKAVKGYKRHTNKTFNESKAKCLEILTKIEKGII